MHCIADYVPAIERHFRHFKQYDFLWLDDLHTNFANFVDADPGQWAIINEINRHVPVPVLYSTAFENQDSKTGDEFQNQNTMELNGVLCCAVMRRLQRLETQLAEIPRAISLGCLSLATAPVRQALHGMALSWKSTFASVVHDRARVRPAHSLALFARTQHTSCHVHTFSIHVCSVHMLLLKCTVQFESLSMHVQSLLAAEREFRERVHTRLEMPATVVSAAAAAEQAAADAAAGGQTSSQLEQLRECLRLLDELRDMENKIDERYLPIETLYARLKQFDLILPKQVLHSTRTPSITSIIMYCTCFPKILQWL